MEFEEAYEKFIAYHKKRASGLRLKQLSEDKGGARKLLCKNIWWPLFGNFDHLHPEYEVFDFKDGQRFLDFAYLPPFLRLNLESDSKHYHRTGITQEQYSDELDRQNDNSVDGWFILRFTYLDIVQQPRRCQQKIQQLIGRWLQVGQSLGSLSFRERAVLKLGVECGGRLSNPIVTKHLEISYKTSCKILQSLTDKGFIRPIMSGKQQRIHFYELIPEKIDVRFL